MSPLLEQIARDPNLLSAVVFGEPARSLTIVGVTGTNGKTTVVHLLDVLHGLGRDPRVPGSGLREVVHLLAEIAEPVVFIEAATGRSVRSPLPVLR